MSSETIRGRFDRLVRYGRLRGSRLIRRRAMQVKKHLRPGGVLPDFLIIGAMKCGTTSLFRMLEQHPGFLPPAVKEVHYFDSPGNYHKGAGWYRAHFPTARQIDKARRRIGYRPRTGEATPAMSFPMYAEWAARTVPEARLVATLRNPVERAWSHYQHYQRHPSPDPASFREAIERELRVLETEGALTAANFDRLGRELQRHGYINRGWYAAQLENWFRYFRREQLLILNFDAWVHRPERAAGRVAEHVGLPPHGFEATRANPGHYREDMPEDCREILVEHFRPWNRRLFQLLGEQWDWPC